MNYEKTQLESAEESWDSEWGTFLFFGIIFVAIVGMMLVDLFFGVL